MQQKKVVENLYPYPDGSPPEDVLWKTLIGNITLNKKEATVNYRRYYDAHVNLSPNSVKEEEEMARGVCCPSEIKI